MTIIRRLVQPELWRVFDVFWANWKESQKAVPAYPILPNVMAASLARLMDLKSAAAYVAFDSETETPVGLLLGMFVPDIHNGQLQGVECLWAGKNTLKLLEEFEKECRDRKCVRIICGFDPHVLGERAPTLRKLYGRKGFRPLTESYVKDLQ